MKKIAEHLKDHFETHKHHITKQAHTPTSFGDRVIRDDLGFPYPYIALHLKFCPLCLTVDGHKLFISQPVNQLWYQ